AHARKPLPSHGALPPMATRQKADRLHLCPARGSSTARAHSNFPSRSVVRLPQLSFLSFFPPSLVVPFPCRIIIRIGSFLRGSKGFRHMTEIDSDAGPRRGPTPHRINQHVIDRKQAGYLGVLLLPPFQARQRCSFIGRVRSNNERHLYPALLYS